MLCDVKRVKGGIAVLRNTTQVKVENANSKETQKIKENSNQSRKSPRICRYTMLARA